MFSSRYISFCVIFLGFAGFVFPQEYVIKRFESNSDRSHEVHPVYFKGDLYFTSNSKTYLKSDQLIKRNKTRFEFKVYARDHLKKDQVFKIYEHVGHKKNVMSVAFCETENIAFFTISNSSKNASLKLQKSGIYLSRILNKWSEPESFEYNSRSHNIANPCFSSDGKRLYFESDMKGTLGGMDIWYCDRISGGWSKPVNLGSDINTSSDEKTPFINSNNELYFSSDKNGGRGGFDIYGYSLDSKKQIKVSDVINTEKDELGYFVSSNGKKGCFSSNKGSDVYNVYEFYFALPDYKNCVQSKIEKKCFSFYDPNPYADSLSLEYKWDFGDGVFEIGNEQTHCYDKPGDYEVKLFTYDKRNESMIDVVSSQTLPIKPSSPYFFQYKEKEGVGVDSRNKENEGLKGESLRTLWYYKNNLSLTSPESIGFDDTNQGENVLTAFIELEDSSYFCLSDTISNSFDGTDLNDKYYELTTDLMLSDRSLESLANVFKSDILKTKNMILNYDSHFNNLSDFSLLVEQIKAKFNRDVKFVQGDFITPSILIKSYE